jgi:uncharacterized protein YhaN
MRITDLDLHAFGPFDGLQLSFEEPAPGLHVLWGPNEAGKSSLRRAILSLLFGIPETTSDNFRHANKNLRLGATVCDDSGGRLSFIRRKGRKNTLLDVAEAALGDDVLAPFLGGLDEAAFTQLFCLDHVRLRHGGKELLAGGGSLGESLFEAASGVVSLRKTLAALNDEAAQLFREKATNPRINAALRRYEQARKNVRELSVRSEQWVKLKRELDEARERQTQAEAALARAMHDRERLRRLQRNRPLIERRQALLMQLSELASTPQLPADAATQRLEALQERAAAQSSLSLCEQRMQQASDKLEALPRHDRLLAMASRLHDLYKNLGSYRDAERDLPKRQSELTLARERAITQWSSMRGPQTPLEQAESMRLPRPQTVRLRELIKQHDTLSTQLAGHLEQAAELQSELESLREQQACLPALVDTAALSATVEAVKSLGNLAERVRQAEAESEVLRQQSQEQLRSALGWAGDVDDFARLRVPASEAVEIFEREQSERHEVRKRLDEAAQRLRQEISTATREREKLEARGEIPTVARLRDVRQRRDDDWLRVRTLIEQPAAVLRHGSDSEDEASLLTRYEGEVVEADRVGDLLRSDSKRAAQAETLQTHIEQRAAELREVTEQSERLELLAAERRSAWRELWSASGVEPRSPREMAAWLTRRQAWLKDHAREYELQARVRSMQQDLRQAQGELRRGLSEVAGCVHDETTPLTTLLITARQILDDMASRRERHAAHAEKQAARQQTLTAVQRRAERARQALEAWRIEWLTATAPLALGADASPGEVETVLDGLEHLFQTLGEVAALQHRISGMSATLTRYREDVATVVGALEVKPPSAKVDESVEWLYRQLQAALESEQQRELLVAARAEQQREADELMRRVAVSEARLRFLSEQAGGVPIESLAQVEEAAERKRKLSVALDDVEAHLLADGAADLTELAREVHEMAPEAVAAELASVDEALTQRAAERNAAIAAAAELASQLRLIDGSERAAAAAQEAQEALAEVRDGAEEYARLQASIWLLRRAIDDYRDKHQGPLLRRAGQLFALLTGGSFCGLRPVYDEHDRPVLMGVRADGSDVGVEGMSEGTVDQLFLSLRLAAIERRLERGETVPLVLDDILIHFDDDRARAALTVLEQMASRTQVLFLTHHAHLVALARETVQPRLLRIHTLGRAAVVQPMPQEQIKPADESEALRMVQPAARVTAQLSMPL